MTLRLKRANDVNYGQFYLSSNELTIETFHEGKLDISHLFHLDGMIVTITITNNSGISVTLLSHSLSTIEPCSGLKWTKFTLDDIKFYRDGTQVSNDILPYDVDLVFTFDKSYPEVNTVTDLTDIAITNPQHGEVLAYDSGSGKFINVPASAGGVVAWNDVQNKPTEFTPESHQHVVADISDFPTEMTPTTHQHVVADISDFPTEMAPTAHTHELTSDIIPTGTTYNETDFNAYNSNLQAVVESFTHQFIPPNCTVNSWNDNVGAGTYSIKALLQRTDSYNNVPSIGFSQLGGHLSFNTGTNIHFANGVTMYMVYHGTDINNLDEQFRFLHGSTNPSFLNEFMYPTNLILLEGVPGIKESIMIEYADFDDVPGPVYDFNPPLLFSEAINTGLNILILRYNPLTTTLSVDINGLPKKTWVHNLDRVNCPYWGICGGGGIMNQEGMPVGLAYKPNLLEFGTAGYIDDATTASMYSTINNYYTSLGLINNTVATYQQSDGKIHLLPVSYNNLIDVPTTFAPSTHQHVVADISDFPTTMPPDAHQHVVADISDFAVNTDGITVQGNGAGTALSTNEYQWKYGGTYNGVLPAYQSGEFWIDSTNHRLLLHKIDYLGNVRGNVLVSLEYCSQIIIALSNKQRNRYSISSINDNQALYVEYVYQTDSKLTVLEEPLVNLVVGKSYQIEVIQQPVFNLDHLLDVVISNPGDGQLLEYDTLQGWINTSVPYLPLGTTSTLYQGDIVAYDSGNSQWRNSDNVAPIWKDLYGAVSIRGAQGNPPTIQAVDANSKFYEFATSNNGLTDIYFEFHMNHDYKLGSDLYFHVHHLTNHADNSNLKVVFTADVSLAQLSYSGSTNPSNSKFFQESGGAVTLASIEHTYDASAQYRHVVTEVQLSSNGGSATTLDSAKVNVDSLILVRLRRNAGAGDDSAVNNHVFVLQSDIHYQCARIGTLRRTYDTGNFGFIV